MLRSTLQFAWSEARREPFRVLFPLAVIGGCIGVGHWMAYAMGWTASASGAFHAAVQIRVYLAAFVAGFLMTAIPRFTGAPHPSSRELAAVLLLLGFQMALLAYEWWTLADVCYAAFLVSLLLFVGRRIRRRPRSSSPPVEFLWIPLAFVLALIGVLVLVLSRYSLVWNRGAVMGTLLTQQGFILPLVFGVGGFLIPRLLGQVHESARFAGVPPARASLLRTRRFYAAAVSATLLLASFPLEAAGEIRLAYALRASCATIEFLVVARLLRYPQGRGLRGILLWGSLWFVIAGLWGPVASPAYRVVLLHLLFLGGLSLMTFVVGAIVTLSHAAPAGALHKRQWVFGFVGATLLIALVGRLAADRVPEIYFPHLGAAAATWIVAAGGWFFWILPFVLRVASRDAFERIHEDAKRRMLESHCSDAPSAVTHRSALGDVRD